MFGQDYMLGLHALRTAPEYMNAKSSKSQADNC